MLWVLLNAKKKLVGLQDDLLKIRSSKSMGGTMQDPAKIRQIRHSIARLLTVMNENEEI